MKLVGVISTAVLSLALGVAVPAFTQDREQDDKALAEYKIVEGIVPNLPGVHFSEKGAEPRGQTANQQRNPPTPAPA